MKTLRFLIFGLLVTTGLVGQAQSIVITNLGTISAADYGSFGITNYGSGGGGTSAPVANIQPMGIPTPAAIAEAITPEIQALADGLQDNPLQIFNYVHDHIRYVLYFGSKKGAELTLLEKSGNDFDQCALLVALLRAAGYSTASYQFGWMLVPYDNPDGSDRDLHHWLGLSLTNSNWSTTANYLDSLFRLARGYPIDASNFDTNTFAFQRVWVTVTIGGTTYNLDPSFKVSQPISGLNLPTAMGFSSNAVMTAAGGLDVGSFATNFYTTNLNEAAIRSTLTGYTTNLLGYLQSNYPNATVPQILSGQSIVLSTNTALPQSLLFPTTNLDGTMPVLSWVNEPTNMMSTMAVSFLSTNYQWFFPQLEGERLSLTTSSSGSAQLWLNDSNIASGSTGGGSGTFNVSITAYHPGLGGSWNTASNLFVQSSYIVSTTKPYKNANASYDILYAFEPDWGWLQERQNQLDAYIQAGYANSSRQVVTESLNIMGLNWLLQTHAVSESLATQIGDLPFFYHRIGRMSQESGAGYYVDVYMQTYDTTSSSSTTDNHPNQWVESWGYFASAMEHGLIEQLQSTNLVGASTVKILELANTNHYAVYLVNSTNWAAVQGKLVNYSLTDLSSLISGGWTLLLPQNGEIAVAGSGSWTGFGFEARQVTPQGVNSQMLIGSGEFGGYVSDPTATIDPTYIDYDGDSAPLYFDSSPVSVPNQTSADPVDMADGTFQVQSADLSLGQTEPRGLSFSRYYNSTRRNSNLAGIAPGWIHNYYLNAATISAPQAGLGGTTPAQMAPMLVATAVAAGVYNGTQPDPKNWLTTALIAKWGVDQLTAKAVSVTLGQNTFQFIKQPDGSFTPPANCTMTLTQGTNGAYSLQERHGRTFLFNKSGWATNILDQYNQSLKLAYNASNWVTSVTDWKGRTLTYNYSTTTPKHLTNVVDSVGRKIGLGYSPSNDLISVTDPESKTSTYGYDTNHQITATFNANSQLVVSNIFNNFGRVTTQLTQGDPNKTWHIFWSGWQTVAQDPAGGQQSYFYDDHTRLVGQSDALGDLTQKFYDGQDHVVLAISPLGETNQFIYDGNNNLIETIDPLGFTNGFVYDGQNDLIQANDALGHQSTYGYNAQFSLTGQTNGAGDWVNYTFNTDGTTASRIDPAGTTGLSYDAYGAVNGITYPNGLGSESFTNNALGDVTNHVDARGFATAYQYNNRRELTNSIAPTNVTVRVAFDAADNVASTTDARGNVTSNTWSATQHLLATILPETAAGRGVQTNLYDNREWLAQSLDPLQHAMQFTNDPAGHLTSVTDPLLQTSQAGYDADGQSIASTNAAEEVTRQSWNLRGKLLQTVDNAGHVIARGYDAMQNQIALTNRNGNVWQFQFDGANRLTNTISPLGRSASLAFNHQGLPASLLDAVGQPTSLYYDAKKRLTNRTDNVGTTLYGLDADDNLTNVVENGLTNSWTYNAYNQVASYQDVYGNLIQFKHDANGNVTNLIYPGGRNVYYAFDSLNHLTNVTDWAGRVTRINYDLASHVTSIIRPNGTQRVIGRDAAGQTTNILEETAIGFPIALFQLNWANSGNMTWEFAAPLPHTNSLPTRTMTYNADNQLATFNGNTVSVDADGNLTSAPLTNSIFAAYAFDARNRLLNAGGVTNAYDALNNRIGQIYGTNTTIFVVNPNAGLPQVLMRIKNGVTNYYIYGVGLMYQITETATTTNTRTYHADYRGSTVALTDDNGNVTDRIEYSAYGSMTYRIGNSDTPFLFDGQYGVMTDPNGLLDMGARYYNPYLCRFISSDPSEFGGGLNTYAFANGNPVSYVDPFGLGSLTDEQLANIPALAPTPFQQQVQGVLAAFVDLATLGVANLVSSATTGNDLLGNNLNIDDAFEQTLQTGAFVASTVLALPTDGASLELEEAAFGSEAITAQSEQLPATLYHYTGEGNVASILENGIQPGRFSGQVFTTPVGSYTPIEAQMYLGLPPNRGLSGALFEIDTATLRSIGINPSAGPMPVLPTPNAMGYGTEILFDQTIPSAALRQIR